MLPWLTPYRFALSSPIRLPEASVSREHLIIFNNWQPEAKSLHPSEGGKWWKETVMKPGVYEYCFVVDGQWLPDPSAKETVPNPFGGKNSVLKVAASSAATEPKTGK
jgi:1,4-alpha-glucan branching enzyme